MNRRQIYFTIAFLVLAAGVVFFLWPRQTNQPLVHLKIVRQTEEQGKPVVFFKVEVADRRRIFVLNVSRLIGERKDIWGTPEALVNFAQTQEIRVLVPMNTAVWKLRVKVTVEERNSLKRLRLMPRMWNFNRGQNQSLPVTIRTVLNGIYFRPEQEIESDWITNAVPKP